MTKEKITLKCHARRKFFVALVIQVMGFIMGNWCIIKFSKYIPETGLWFKATMPTNLIIGSLCIFILTCIVVKEKNNKYIVYSKHKICVKNSKRIRYQKIVFSQSFMQKIFGLCTLKFKETSKRERIKFKDVSIKELKKWLQ